MPAAAVIPAPIAYIKVVAVKKLVVGFRVWLRRSASRVCTVVRPDLTFWGAVVLPLLGAAGNQDVYFEKIRVFKAGIRSEYISME